MRVYSDLLDFEPQDDSRSSANLASSFVLALTQFDSDTNRV